jgi:hypothetical protein
MEWIKFVDEVCWFVSHDVESCQYDSCISRALSQHNIKSLGLPPRKISSFHLVSQWQLGTGDTSTQHLLRRQPGLHWTDDCSNYTMLKKHLRHNHMEHPGKSVTTEHRINLGHRFQLDNTSVLSTKHRYMGHIIREATETELHGHCLSNLSSALWKTEGSHPHRIP